LHKKIAALGYNAIGYPSEYGGSDGDQFEGIVVNEEFCRCGSFGLVASLFSHGISVPPIINHGTPEQKENFLKPVIEGDRMSGPGTTKDENMDKIDDYFHINFIFKCWKNTYDFFVCPVSCDQLQPQLKICAYKISIQETTRQVLTPKFYSYFRKTMLKSFP